MASVVWSANVVSSIRGGRIGVRQPGGADRHGPTRRDQGVPGGKSGSFTSPSRPGTLKFLASAWIAAVSNWLAAATTSFVYAFDRSTLAGSPPAKASESSTFFWLIVPSGAEPSWNSLERRTTEVWMVASWSDSDLPAAAVVGYAFRYW